MGGNEGEFATEGRKESLKREAEFDDQRPGCEETGLGRREGEQAAAAGRASTGEAGFRPGEPHAGVMAPRPLPTLDFVL